MAYSKMSLIDFASPAARKNVDGGMSFRSRMEAYNFTGDRYYIECEIPKEVLLFWEEIKRENNT